MYCGSLAFLSLIHWVIPNSIWFLAEINSFLNQLIFLRWNLLCPDWQLKEYYLPTWAWTLPWKHHLRIGCWDPTVHAALAADVPLSPWPAQGSPEPRVSWFRQLCWTDTCRAWSVIAGSEKCQQQHRERRHAFIKCSAKDLFILLQWKSIGHLFDKLIRLDRLCYYESNLELHLKENKKITDTSALRRGVNFLLNELLLHVW